MRSYRKTILTAVLIGAVAAAMDYENTPKTPESCRTFREDMKQLVMSDSGLTGVLITANERVLDEAMHKRYGAMTADQCTAALPELKADLAAYPQTTWAPKMHQAGDEGVEAISHCRDERKNGQLKTRADSARCSNVVITAAFTKAGYPYPDLLKQLTDFRLAQAERIDQSATQSNDDDVEGADFVFGLTEQERKRIVPPAK